jgi:hypothetical protein
VLGGVDVMAQGRELEGEKGRLTCTLTFNSTLMSSESMLTGVAVLTGTILCVLTSYSEPMVTWRIYLSAMVNFSLGSFEAQICVFSLFCSLYSGIGSEGIEVICFCAGLLRTWEL